QLCRRLGRCPRGPPAVPGLELAFGELSHRPSVRTGGPPRRPDPSGFLAREVRSVRPHEVRATLGLLPLLLAAEWRQVEEGVGATGPLGAAGEVRVGVEDLVAHPEEDAVAGLLLRASRRDRQWSAQ